MKKSFISFNFVGKDSVKFENTIEVPSYVAKAIKSFCKNKKDDDQIFDLIDASDINKFLSECMPECTAKLFRTAIASKLLVDAFKEQKVTKGMTLREKLHAFDMANLAVATKLNHKRALPKNFNEQLGKMDKQIEDALKKEKETTAKAKENIKKINSQLNKFSNLPDNDLKKVMLKNLKDKKAKETAKIEKAQEKVKSLQEKKEFKSTTGEIALGTSKTNYITPQLAYSICSDLDIPVEKILTTTLQKKFAWAKDTPKTYWKKYPNV